MFPPGKKLFKRNLLIFLKGLDLSVLVPLSGTQTEGHLSLTGETSKDVKTKKQFYREVLLFSGLISQGETIFME